MAFDFRDLDDRTRVLMLAEVDLDRAGGRLYESRRLTADGADQWEHMFRHACEHGDDVSLAEGLGLTRRAEYRGPRAQPESPR